VRIADLVLQRLARLSCDVKERSVIPFEKYEERRAPFQLRRPLLIAVGESLRYLGSSCGTLFSSAASTSAKFLAVAIWMCSTCNIRRVTVGSDMICSEVVWGVEATGDELAGDANRNSGRGGAQQHVSARRDMQGRN
jgi:hypothetical protein